MTQKYPSALLENAVNELSLLPGIGRKTALRLAMHLLKKTPHEVNALGNALISLRNEVQYCKQCHNISDTELCAICSNTDRDQSIVCVVENVKDVMAIENTLQYKGLYHVLGGIISPMEGIGPADLSIDSLVQKAQSDTVKEVILALSTTMEGDTTNFYIYRKIARTGLVISTLSKGVPIGDELEYTDEITLGRSILYRTEFSV